MSNENIQVYIPENTNGLYPNNQHKDYDIHDNGKTSYITRIFPDNTMVLFKYETYMEPIKIFIGKSPKVKMTEYSGGINDKFDGNTVLIQVEHKDTVAETPFRATGSEAVFKTFQAGSEAVFKNPFRTTGSEAVFRYKHIGRSITEFTTEYEIIDFVSLLGNNDVPYPYAIDTQNNYYLIIEKMVLKNSDILQSFLTKGEDPYTFYYQSNLLTEDIGIVPPRQPIINTNISKFYIDNEQYTLRCDNDIPKGKIKILYKDKDQPEEISKEMYTIIMKEFKDKLGLSQMCIV